MAAVTMKELLETGVHFGHQTNRWNPKMKPYIFCARNGIYIIDLQQTVKMFNDTMDIIRDEVGKGKKVLFVGTKKQAIDAVKEEATRAGMFYVNNRWLGGMLTNFSTVKQSIRRLKELEKMKEDGTHDLLTKKEVLKLEKEREKLEKILGGIKNMGELPGLLFVVDPKKETIAVTEARKLGIPVAAIVDTNCDPDVIDHIIPGNDDAIRAIKLFCEKVADACVEGAGLFEENLMKGGAAAGAEAKTEAVEAESEMEAAVVSEEKPAAPRQAVEEKKPAAEKKPAEKKPATEKKSAAEKKPATEKKPAVEKKAPKAKSAKSSALEAAE